MSSGWAHSCALHESGRIDCWEASSGWYDQYDYGQALAPVGRYQSVSAGFAHTCALRESGEVLCWGATSPAARVPSFLQ